ncbi:hypothetical protein B0O80DRAFT_224726 [Mortierella sp. GBAus27b]|nr:hypothetical protein B0O80DRAFT_224726 [Mortierella sp. GBAus27b]
MPTRPIPLSEINTENHGQDQRQSLQHRAFPEPTDHRLVFQHRSYPEGTAIDIVGIKPSSIATPHTPCQIPDKAPTFKFSTRFPSCKTGQYAVRWRIKVLENFSIPVGLRFSVNVYYSAEHDIMSAQDIIMSSTQLTERDCWYDLQLEELTVICPHEGDANVVLTLSNCESKDSLQNNGFEHSGLVVDSVELVSFDLKDNSDREVRLHIVKGAGQSEFSFDSKDSPVFEHDNPGILPISRIAWSKESTFLAALAFKGDTAYLTVWNLDRILDPAEPSVIHRQCGTAAFKHEKDEESKSFSDLSIGLAISPRGEQVAIYQEPKIGQWTAGTRMDKCYFQFCLFDNLLARPLSHYSLEMATKHTKGDTQQRGLERVVGLPHQVLKSFVGYGTFLMERGEGEWETIDTTQSDDAEANEDEHAPTHRTLFAACNGLDLCLFKINSENKWSHIHTIGLSDLAPTFNRRVNCKIMMDMITSNTFTWFEAGGQCCTIWDMHKGSNVAYVSSTTGSRFGGLTFRGNTRMAISPDQSIIALTSGDGNLSTYYTNSGILIDSEEYSGYSIEYVAFHGHSYQVFLILRDNISLELSSYIVDPLHLQSGTAANQVPIPSIGKSVLTLMRQGIYQNQGLVCETNGSMVRCYVSYKPADYRSIERTDSYKADITRDQVKDCGKLYGLRTENIREPFRDGSGLLYWIVRLSVVRVNPLNGSQDTIFSFVPEPWMRVSTMEVPYPVHLQQAYFLPDKSDKQEGSGGTRFVVVGMQTIQIWSLPMEDIEDNEEIEECNLEFIWSRPLGKDEFAPDPEKRTRKCEPVGYKYHDIQSADIYMDPATGNATADIKLHNGVRTNHIVIPPTYGSEPQITFLYCARSIHLLANAYYFARQDSRRQASDPQMIALSDHKHSEAIVRFARGHVNRLLSADDFYPQQTFKEAPHDSSEIHGKHSHANYANLSFEKLPISPAMITPDGPILMDQVIERDRLQRAGTMATTATKTRRKRHRHSRSNPVATLLTLLFSRADLHVTNCAFIEGLLQLEVGGWVPHVSKELNPIALAIKAKHDQLLKVLIDYCIKQAMRHHPLYLVPLDQCLAELLVPYHDLVADIFRRTSYLPAHNQAYVAINASRNSLDLVHFRARPTPYASIFTKFKTPKSIQDCNNPVFALQSQLPTSTGILGSGNSRDRKFPDIFTDLPVHNIPDIIYVCPFQFLPTTRSFSQLFKRKREDSVFAQMAGKDFFDSPSVVVALRFKW